MFSLHDLSIIPSWLKMWGLAFAIYLVCKVLSWSARSVEAPVWKHFAYLVVWPGMDCDTFFNHSDSSVRSVTCLEWLFAFVKLGMGLGILWGIVPTLGPAGDLIQAWVGMMGIILTLHFGLFHVLSCSWRSVGVAAAPIMNWPILSENVAEFWGRRWNLAFRDLTHRFLFSPLRRPLGPTGALLAGFVVSGLVHDLVISGPSGAGWGLPTVYFTLQGIGLVAERSRFGKALGLRRGLIGRLYCIAVVVFPSPLLFHSAFVTNVIRPFLVAIGSAA